MKNMLAITQSIIGLFLVTACLSSGQLLAQENGLEAPPTKKEESKQNEETQVPEMSGEKPAFTPFAKNDPDQPIDKEEALKQWEAQQKEAADSAKALGNGQRRGQQIIIRKSSTTVNSNGEKQTKSSGKMVIIGPDGKRKEIELDEMEDMEPMNFNIPGFAFGRPAIRLNQPNSENAKEGFAIGSVYRPVTDAMRSQLDLGDRGLLVLSVSDDSPAAKAGVEKYDILIFADDKELETKKDLDSVVEIAGKEKQSFSLGLIRKGKELTVEVSPIEKSKLRSKNVIRFGGNMNFAQPLNLQMVIPNNIDFRNMEEDMHKQMLENIQKMEQAAEQFNNQRLELRDKN
jgi:hypothetical protein